MIRRIDFIDRISKKGYTKHDATLIVDDFLRTLEEALVEGESVVFRGFGTFEVRERAATERISPTTKERVHVPAYRTPYFAAGKLLKREVKEGMIRE